VKSANKMIALVALVCAAPFISAWVAYYFFKPEGGQSYGALLEVKPVPPMPFTSDQAALAKNKFLLVHKVDGSCDKACEEALYPTRQARTLMHKDKDRVLRVAIGSAPTLSPEQIAQHPDLVVINAAPPSAELTSLLATKIVLIDPLGNQVIAWDRTQDLNGIKRLHGDLSRLMRASKWEAK
jgi:hypothetical protein